MKNNKKAVLFVVSDFDVGGITVSLRNLTDILVKEGHRIGIINLMKAIKLPDGFNPEVELIDLRGKALLWNLCFADIKRAPLYKKPYLIGLALLKKRWNKSEKWQRFIFSKTNIKGFDVSVAFRQSPLCYRFAKENVAAGRTIGFWHGDPRYCEGIESWINVLSKVDYVACVSNAVENAMRDMFPQYSEKYKTVYNTFNDKDIIEKSTAYSVQYPKDGFNIVTVSRVEFAQKQLDFIPVISKRLKDSGLKHTWTIVGDGPDMQKLSALIKQYDVCDTVICEGTKQNPYPYVRNADLFVNTSVLEAYGMVITEALILNTPCVAAYYDAAKEIIDDNVNGIICENSVEALTNCIAELIENKEKFNLLRENAKNYKYSYADTYNSFLELCC